VWCVECVCGAVLDLFGMGKFARTIRWGEKTAISANQGGAIMQ